MNRTACLVALAVSFTACQFDATVPPTRVISCKEGLACPNGLSCVPNLGVCVDRTTGDLEAPFLTGSQLGAALLRRERSTTLTLTANERLALPPLVRLVQADTTRPLALTEEREGHFLFNVAADATTVEGPATLVVDLIDAAGNEAPNVTAGVLRFDFTPPSLAGLAIIAPRSSVDGGLLVRGDENVGVRVSLSEPVVSGATLVGRPFGCQAAEVAFDATANRDGLLDFSHVAPAGNSGCSYHFVVGGLTDLAGNQALEEERMGEFYAVDSDAPAITGLGVFRESTPGVWTASNLFSHQPSFSRIGVGFEVAGDAVELGVRIGAQPLQGCTLSSCTSDGGAVLGCWCTREVLAAEPEGAASIRVTARDQAGNASASEAPISFDFSAPRVRSLSVVSPRTSADGGVIDVRPTEPLAVRLVVDEPVDDTASLATHARACAGTPPSLSLSSNLGGLLDFSLAAPTGSPGCTYDVTVDRLVDRVGNVAAPDGQTVSYVVDGDAPAISQLELLREADAGLWVPATTFSRQPGFAQLGVRFVIDGSAATTEVRVNGVTLPNCALTSSCVGAGATYRCFCSRAVTSTDVEGPGGVLVTGVDAAGNTRSVALPLAFDFTAPALLPGTTSVALTPPPGAPLSAVTKLGAGATARVLFSLTEPVVTPPTVATPAPDALTFTRTSGAATSFVYAHVLDGGTHVQGARSIEIAAADAVNNRAVMTVSAAFSVDTIAPAAPSTAADGGAVYRRNPWGTGTGPRDFKVVGPSLSAEPNLVVRAVDQAQLSSAGELGRSSVDVDGGFVVDLGNADRPVVYLSLVDEAGNQSPAVDVKNVVWRATLGNKVRGSSFENPHSIETRSWFAPSLSQREGVEVSQYALLDRVDAGVVSQVSANRSWTFIDVDTNPSPRRGNMIVYDSRRRVSVVFGGQASATGFDLADTLEWDGVSWLRRSPLDPEGDGNPPTYMTQAGAFDALRSRVVLFGGPDTVASETWEWDGSSWARRIPVDPEGDGNPMSNSPCMAYDSVRQRTLVFVSTNGVGELWEWNGASWRRRSSSGPPARYSSCGLAFNHVAGVAVLMGGYSQAGNGSALDVWEWNDIMWTKKPRAGTWPGLEGPVSAVFDGARTLFVGQNGGDVWAWNGTTMADVTGANPPSSEHVTFDSARGRIVMLTADYTVTGIPSRTWEYTTAWVNRTPAGNDPPVRERAAATFDTTRNRTLIFGGINSTTGTDLGDTWEWSGSTWLHRVVTGPQPLYLPALTWDVPRARAVMLGATQTGTPPNQTWEWDGTTWFNRTLASGNPTPIATFGIAYDQLHSRTVVFGGESATNAVLNQTWLWNGSTWTRALPATSPPARVSPAMAYDIGRQRVVMFGGDDNMGNTSGETWEWNGTTWANKTTLVGPSPRARAAMAYDQVRGHVVLFGGFDNYAAVTTPGDF